MAEVKQGLKVFQSMHAAAAGMIAFFFYYITLAPTVMWGDPAKLADLAYENLLRLHSASHPLHSLIGHYWGMLPFTDYAFGQNMLSAVFSSLTVMAVYLIVFHLTDSLLASYTASLSLAVSHTFWWLAVMTESYSIAFFFLAYAILAMILWLQTEKPAWLYAAAFSIGAGMSDHYMLAVLAPVFIVAALVMDPSILRDPKKIFALVLSFCLGAGLLFYIYFTQYPPLTKEYMIESTDIESIGKMIRELVRYPLYLFYQFPVIGFIAGLVGFRKNMKYSIPVFILLALIFFINYFFSAMYMWQRQPEMMVFGYLVFAVWIGFGVSKTEQSVAHINLPSKLIFIAFIIIFPILLYACSPFIAGKMGGNILHVRQVPYRNNDQYFLNPNKRGYYGARIFGEEVFIQAGKNAIIISDFTPFTVLKYLQVVEQKRRDVLLVFPKPGRDNPLNKGVIEQSIKKRPIYIIDVNTYSKLLGIDALKEKYNFKKTGNLYRVEEK